MKTKKEVKKDIRECRQILKDTKSILRGSMEDLKWMKGFWQRELEKIKTLRKELENG